MKLPFVFWRAVVGFAIALSVLFFHVWWPIQAERSLARLKNIELQISMKKSELNRLKARYASLSSLSLLDEWAKRNGPWRPPTANDVTTIES